MSEWQPIGKKVKARTVILYNPKLDDPNFVGHPYTVSNPDYVNSGNAAMAGYTHWMPLPEPPK